MRSSHMLYGTARWRRRAGRIALAILSLVLVGGAGGPALADAAIKEAPSGGILFTYTDAYAGAVYVSGDFNDWNATANPMEKGEGGLWSTVLDLGAGAHEYKFVVDGQWIADPENPVTVGDYGNSAANVGEDGKLVAMKATSNTEYSPKIYLGSRYHTLFKLIRDQGRNPQWDLERPYFDIDLDWRIRISDVAYGHVLTKINNEGQNVQEWETSLRFDRGSLNVDTETFSMIAFDSDSVGTWDDPLHIVGNVGVFRHAWGFNQMGVEAWKDFGHFALRGLYSDDFRAGGTQGPGLEGLLDNVTEADNELKSYATNPSDNNKDVLALRATVPIGPHWRAAGSYRLDRGRNPGAFISAIGEEIDEDNRRIFLRTYPLTVENWQAGGLDFDFKHQDMGLDFFGEFLAGESWVSQDTGDSISVIFSKKDPPADDPSDTVSVSRSTLGYVPGLDDRLDLSYRFKVGAHYYAYRGWHWRGTVEFQDHDLVSGPGYTDRRYNRLTTYGLGLEFQGEEWMEWPWQASLGFEYYDFAYAANAEWLDQLWFDDHNFWLEQGGQVVSVDRLVMLGGHDVVSWRPQAKWTFSRGSNGTLEYQGLLNSHGVTNKPKYWQNLFLFHIDLGSRMGLNVDTRIVSYDDPVLKLNETFASYFLELKYFFAPEIEVALSYGVDPWVMDIVRNEFGYIGRDLFLFSRGANGDAAKDRFLDLSDTIYDAEQDLEDATVIQLQAIVRF